ncbi:S8 family peptidase [Sphingobacterium litopenaei]|uniref:S8 family peptidase n=1 Tax=Sphingobacterium litopenaei TaxID=2763500 RepID=A0ABR7Y9P4_9SPHI|nr:S8 family peptidase [Sphingobacterium litopenaei]MBD1428007.1 S8 family peptidase [Sphingobacterium litopenaei]
MHKTKLFIALLGIGILPFTGFAQDKKDKAPANWYNLDYKSDGIMGVSTEKAYELLKGRKATPVIVAVIDGGVDVYHEDLKDVLWINKKEANANGKDDDKNGYIDDKFGWNFIGNANGENVNYDNLEVTRQIKKLDPIYASVLPSTKLNEAQRREFVAYQKMIADYTSKYDEANFGNTNYGRLKLNVDKFVAEIGKEPKDITKTDIENYKTENRDIKTAISIIKKATEKDSFEKFYEDIKEADEYFGSQIKYHLNKEFDPRHIVGDNYEDATERYYGNPDVKGPDASHGTHVAGIIAAKRNNNIGVNGVADNVEIMSIRVVPNGDERDKDVANGIRYAVDNGAKVINMSFGKGYVSNKKAVDEAVRYAQEKDVLLVHAAGNDGKDIDINPNFPTKYFTNDQEAITGEASNWITVGATSWKLNDELLASFSNFGYKSVDVFAPGVEINSTMPENKYKEQQGTSMAAPVVSGVAALLRAYYPQLSAKEVKEIILKSVTKVDQKVKIKKDGSSKKVYLDEISVSGGIVNAYNAIVEANNYINKKK